MFLRRSADEDDLFTCKLRVSNRSRIARRGQWVSVGPSLAYARVYAGCFSSLEHATLDVSCWALGETKYHVESLLLDSEARITVLPLQLAALVRVEVRLVDPHVSLAFVKAKLRGMIAPCTASIVGLGVCEIHCDSQGVIDSKTSISIARKRTERDATLFGVDHVTEALHRVKSSPLLLCGPHGVGKRSVVSQFCRTNNLVHVKYREGLEQDIFGDDCLVCVEDIQSFDLKAMLRLLDNAARVVGIATSAEDVPAMLLRRGRFDTVVHVSLPPAQVRAAILGEHFERFVAPTTGYSCAELVQVMQRSEWNSDPLQDVRPSALLGVGIEMPSTEWSEIGGQSGTIEKLQRLIMWPLLHGDQMTRFNVRAPRGVLLHGPPGGGKTTMVRALASNISACFLTLSGASVYSPYAGAAEKAIRECFFRARALCPCIIFIDELDALVGSRGTVNEGNRVQERVLAQMLTEMDGVESVQQGLLVVGATNRVDLIDEALLRPGRFDVQLRVGAPETDAQRLEILQVHTRAMPLHAGVSLQQVAARCAGYSGAQLKGLCREAALSALREDVQLVQQHHFAV